MSTGILPSLKSRWVFTLRHFNFLQIPVGSTLRDFNFLQIPVGSTLRHFNFS